MLLPPVSDELKFVVETAVECPKCGYCSKNRSEDRILYVNHTGDLKDAIGAHFGKTELPCSCGQLLTVRNALVGLPRSLIVSIKRYKMKDGELIKITDPISAGSIFLETDAGAPWEPAVRNCIVHTGGSLNCGHYTWWTRFGGGYLLLNDRNVETSTEDALQDGVIFMFK